MSNGGKGRRKLFACGFNEFGQLPLLNAEFQASKLITTPRECVCCPLGNTLTGFVTLIWSRSFINKGTEILGSGFLDGLSNQKEILRCTSEVKSIHNFKGSLISIQSSFGGIVIQRSLKQLEHIQCKVEGHSGSNFLHLDSDEETLFAVTGNNHVGRLEVSEDRFIYHSLFTEHPVITLSCGKDHVLLLTETGGVFSFGCGSRGQLGHGVVQDRLSIPTEVDALAAVPMTGVSAGGWHSAAISVYGDLYIWGWNESGQLGYPMKTKQERAVPARSHSGNSPITEEECRTPASIYQCKQVSSITSHTQEETNVSQVTFLMSPQILDMSPQSEVLVKSVSSGSRHTAAVTNDGRLYTWGFGRWGQLGHGNEWTQDAPTLVVGLGSNVKVLDVYCKEWNTFILTKD